ncbi:MAG: VWA domain-containing protein [Alphaproteobacteria bacterium]|nr:MAG: VWA domain-containing protein [Alphaproteobacteria bacterium]
MSFVNSEFLPYAIVGIILITIIMARLNSIYFKWVKSYWFFERSWASRISSFFYILSLLLFLLALLDLRGPEKKIRASLPDQRTIILLDTSASMLAEDVRPNRFVKSLQIARHFVKNAPGHQISIVLFSDIQKRLIPFTDDIDLIDSRLAALEKTNSVGGGSSISQAAEEAVQYFEFDSSDDDKSKTGNMLVFTDAEESEGDFKVKIPSGINLAIVGVGTAKGGNIPLRWEDGSFKGYKNFKGEPVITKLDEEYIKKMGKNAQNFKYWIVNSYSLPTEDLMNFFRASYNKKQSTGDVRIRPVYSHYILIPAILLFCLSVLIGRFPVFKIPKVMVIAFALVLGFTNNSVKAQDKNVEEPMRPNPEIKKDLDLIREGKASREHVLKTAEKMLRANDTKNSTELYKEYSKKDDSEAVRFNLATALMKSSRLKEALPIVQDLMKNSKNEALKDNLRKNLRLSLDQKKKEDEQKKNDEKNDKENKKEGNQGESKDQGKSEKQGDKQEDQKDKDGKDGQGKQDQKKPDPNGKSGEDKKENQQDKDKNKNKQDKQDGKEKNKEEEGKEPSGPSTLTEKEKEIEQKRRMVKTPAMIKQIMSDDRELQQKMMDTSTRERGEQKPKRDW